jgi:hypothetical protein
MVVKYPGSMLHEPEDICLRYFQSLENVPHNFPAAARLATAVERVGLLVESFVSPSVRSEGYFPRLFFEDGVGVEYEHPIKIKGNDPYVAHGDLLP